jgi:hypothetical protein
MANLGLLLVNFCPILRPILSKFWVQFLADFGQSSKQIFGKSEANFGPVLGPINT